MRKLVAAFTPLILVTMVMVFIASSTAETPAASTPEKKVLSVRQLVQMEELGVAVRVLRGRTWECQDSLTENRFRAEDKYWDLPRSIPYRNWTRDLWKDRNGGCQERYAKRVLPATNDWQTAVRIAQRPFPGTESWALSCSGAEGGHSVWVVYGGGSYYEGAEYDNTFHGDMVGGPMQYMWGTFKGHYRHALDSLRERGFIVDLPHQDDVAAWRSMQAQAFAATWARWSGNDNSHWSASFGNGC